MARPGNLRVESPLPAAHDVPRGRRRRDAGALRPPSAGDGVRQDSTGRRSACLVAAAAAPRVQMPYRRGRGRAVAPRAPDPLAACLDANGTYICTAFNPRCYIIQKVRRRGAGPRCAWRSGTIWRASRRVPFWTGIPLGPRVSLWFRFAGDGKDVPNRYESRRK